MTSMMKEPACQHRDLRVQWVELFGLSNLGQALIDAADGQEIPRVILGPGRIVRIQIQGTQEFALRSWPIKVIEEMDGREFDVSLGQGVIQLNRFESRSLAFRH